MLSCEIVGRDFVFMFLKLFPSPNYYDVRCTLIRLLNIGAVAMAIAIAVRRDDYRYAGSRLPGSLYAGGTRECELFKIGMRTHLLEASFSTTMSCLSCREANII
jgi:hypothetical protein